MTTTEEYFIALGFRFYLTSDKQSFPNGYWSRDEFFREKFETLPDILDSFTQLKKWVIDPMEAEGWEFSSGHESLLPNVTHSVICNEIEGGGFIEVEITNGDIPEAMIKSATRYWESKK